MYRRFRSLGVITKFTNIYILSFQGDVRLAIKRLFSQRSISKKLTLSPEKELFKLIEVFGSYHRSLKLRREDRKIV